MTPDGGGGEQVPTLTFRATSSLTEYHGPFCDAQDGDEVTVPEDEAARLCRDFPKNFKSKGSGKSNPGKGKDADGDSDKEDESPPPGPVEDRMMRGKE